jgi:translation elongation factor EF-Tu-like GTPase
MSSLHECQECGMGDLPSGGRYRKECSQFEDLKETTSDWALVVENSYSVSGRGFCENVGRLLFGTPKKGDTVAFVDWQDNTEGKWVQSELLGIMVGKVVGLGAGDEVGLLLKERVGKGICLIGISK